MFVAYEIFSLPAAWELLRDCQQLPAQNFLLQLTSGYLPRSFELLGALRCEM